MRTTRDGSAVSARRGSRGRAGRGRRLWWAVLAVGLLVLVVAAVLAIQARSAYRHLSSAADLIPRLEEQVIAGDDPAARATAEQFAEHARVARESVHGPHWALLAALPGLGPNVDAVQTVTAAIDDLATEALPDIVEAGRVVDPASLAPRGGRVRLGPIERAAPSVVSAHEAVASVAERLEAIETDRLVGRLRGPVVELTGKVAEVRSRTGTAARAAELIPPMLGADGPRHYLLLTQNNAEPRALGGLPGAVILLRADRGRIELVEQRAANEFGNFGTPVLRLTRAERTLFGTQLGRYLLNVTSTPDFPRAAQLAQEMWRIKTGRRVDGVASVDPYALQLLLRASGPVRLPTGQRLTGQNTARVLLNQVYREIPDPAAQDAFFALAASAIFDKVMSGKGDLAATTRALAEATGQGRVLLWAAHDDEQAVLTGTPLSGELRGEADGSPVVGVYVHDRNAAKIAYYQRLRAKVAASDCRPDGSRHLEVSVTVTNDVPDDVAGLPDYLTGGGSAVPVGHIKTEVLVYAPTGGLITDFRASDGYDFMTTYFHQDLHVAKRVVTLAPGRSVTLHFDIESREELRGPVRLRVTPGPEDGRSLLFTSQCPT
ncbi:MAG: DUF4012 domain-containing protein [Nocardioidaceae bacterium]